MTGYFLKAFFRVDIYTAVSAHLYDHAVGEVTAIAGGQGDPPPVVHCVLISTPEIDQCCAISFLSCSPPVLYLG